MKLVKWVVIIVVIVCSFVGLVWFLGIGGAIAAFFESLLILVLTNPYQAVKIFASLLTPFRKFWFWAEKTKVAGSLQGTIGLSSKRVNEEGVNLLPHGIEIKWVKPMERDAFLKQDKVVVCLESSYNEARNLARATMLYVGEDLVQESRRFVDPTIMKSADFVIARKMLMMDRRIDAIRCLNEEFIDPEVSKKPKIREYVSSMEKIDAQGYLTRILLREFSELDARLSPALSDARAEAETINFTQKLQELAEKKKGVDIYPTHIGQVIRVSIMPVAREEARPDPAPYVDFAKKCSDDGILTLYVVARGVNVPLAEWAVEETEKRGLYKKQNEWRFRIPKVGKRGYAESYVAVLSEV